ncbi:Putative amidoligase enzyme [Rhodobacteraceae bacterium THAF1]|uniref:amidoligase family protein n=1 Tax=Palleronia sp. THAF1 TaxID=2587842 RepID=UPI000F3AC87C|nr:amidoligase family protein [Palleronia sp. THAF1]QFU10206.1 Putative amidoligase enzyme [Palleronia sp. THAF1]VDC16889.1 Putative amidoligase enzyme [Rhodobacteraceae bacterium THAF1]
MPEIADLPVPNLHDGTPRRVGIEIECGGLDEDAVARIIAETLGGTVTKTADYERRIDDTEIGSVEVLLDTALRDTVDSQMARRGLDLGRSVIPVEFVTEPILPSQIARVDALCDVLVQNGAYGTRDGILLGFGVHLNVALPGTQVDDILPMLTAFALTEDWLRARMGIDASRRLLPFVDTYPTELLDRLCDPETDWTLERIKSAYLETAPSRNHALDALPILKHLDEGAVVAAVPQMEHKSGRPAWHYRLPDCRLDEDDWSVALEWNRWCAVEGVAADSDLLDDLKQCWRAYRDRLVPIPGRWAATSAEILDDAVTLP